MTRTLYLIRHAMPDIPFDERWCVGGRSDIPLGPFGHVQASLLASLPELLNVEKVFCSRLSRAFDTALAISGSPVIADGLEEQDMGVWDGLSFKEIKARFPDLYAAREKDMSLVPDGAETPEALKKRFTDAVYRCIDDSSGDIAIVCHKGCIATLTGNRDKLLHASVSVFRYDGNELTLSDIGIVPHPALDDEVCRRMMTAAGADSGLLQHCQAVADTACMLCDALNSNGLQLDKDLIRSASLLHDIARAQKGHPAAGAKWLSELGYPEIADIIRQHHDPDSTALNEAAVVFISDKAVNGSQPVSIEERFAASLAKCRTPEALDAHNRRLETARKIRKNINSLCRAELL